MNRLSVALLHHPVVDRHDEIYTTAITNIDVHDIARSACTFGLDQYYLVSPISAQQEMARTIAGFWLNEAGQSRNPDRSRAMGIIKVESDLETCVKHEQEIIKSKPVLIATSAKICEKKTITYQAGRALLNDSHAMLILGTGYGLAPSIIEQADYLLEPIYGVDDYNHLSVRSAAAIIFDRLRGSRFLDSF